jgi:hypothetical protein
LDEPAERKEHHLGRFVDVSPEKMRIPRAFELRKISDVALEVEVAWIEAVVEARIWARLVPAT